MPTLPGNPTVTLTAAIDTFTRGFTFTRSRTHPYLAEPFGSLWAMRDTPRRTGRYRTEEWVTLADTEPAAVDDAVRTHARSRFMLCVVRGMQEPQAEVREAFKAAGYRSMTTEPLMVHRLRRIPKLDAPATIERIRTPEHAARFAEATRTRPMPPEELGRDAPLRQYTATIDGEIVGWARSIVCGDATWCASMFVKPKHRRRGIARALLSRLLRDDCAAGAAHSVLLASHTGAKLYPTVGYEIIGELLMFAPRKNLPVLTARATRAAAGA